MTFEEWAKAKGYPFHDLEPTFNGSKDRYSDIAKEAWNAAALAERDACAKHFAKEPTEQWWGVDVAAAIRARTE